MESHLPSSKLKGQGFVLAGGRSSRMGSDKALLSYEGMDFVSRAVSTLQQLALPVRVVTDVPERFTHLSVPILVDRIPDGGPLAGLATALSASESQHNYFLPCDTPLVGPRLYEALAGESGHFDVVVPQDGLDRKHLLCAYYSRDCLESMDWLLCQGVRRVEAILEVPELRVHLLSTPDWGIPDSSFLNVNTPKDLERLRSIQP